MRSSRSLWLICPFFRSCPGAKRRRCRRRRRRWSSRTDRFYKTKSMFDLFPEEQLDR